MLEDTTTMMKDQKRLTYLTRHYYELQGIRIAPLWFFWIVILAKPTYFERHGVFILVAAGLVWLWPWLASRYYKRRFGLVNPAWRIFTTGRIYWSLSISLCFMVWMIYCICFDKDFFWSMPYYVPILYCGPPLFDSENPPLRRVYYALAATLSVASTMLIQLTHRENSLIFVILCLIALALCVADHLFLMSLCIPLREDTDA